MKLLLTTIAAVLVVGCATTQQPEPLTPKAPDISIHDAVEKGNIEAVKYHLIAGTKVDAKNDVGWTPLQMAAGEGQKEIAELLIAKGADVNANTPDGLTVFFAAILGANKEIVELLIAKGADVNVRGFGGMTPLNMADDEGKKKSPLSSASTAARRVKNWKAVNQLLKRHSQNRRQAKLQTSQFTKLLTKEISKPSKRLWLLERM